MKRFRLFALAAVLFLVACNEPTHQSNAFFSGALLYFPASIPAIDTTGMRNLTLVGRIEGAPGFDPGSCEINGTRPMSTEDGILLGSYFYWPSTGRDFLGRYGIDSGTTSITFRGEANGGYFRAELALPDTVGLVSPQDGSTLQVGDSLFLKWTGNADFYTFTLVYAYEDSGTQHYTYLEDSIGMRNGILLGDTTIVVPSKFIQRPGNIEMGLLPCNGPPPIEGAPGNVGGSATGFLIAASSGHGLLNSWIFVVGSPASAAGKIEKTRSQQVTQRLLSRITNGVRQ